MTTRSIATTTVWQPAPPSGFPGDRRTKQRVEPSLDHLAHDRLRQNPFLDLRFRGEPLAALITPCVRLDWEDLRCFEPVDQQFQHLGVVFHNAIALCPSNPAFPAYSGSMVLIGAPTSGWIEATFLRPVQFVGAFITSSRRTVMTAFNSNDQPLAHTESSGANLATVPAASAPNVRLSVQAAAIHRVVFHCFDGHLTLDDFCFGVGTEM